MMKDTLNKSLLDDVMLISPTRNSCTYCGAAIEDYYPPLGIVLAVILFPIGFDTHNLVVYILYLHQTFTFKYQRL